MQTLRTSGCGKQNGINWVSEKQGKGKVADSCFIGQQSKEGQQVSLTKRQNKVCVAKLAFCTGMIDA